MFYYNLVAKEKASSQPIHAYLRVPRAGSSPLIKFRLLVEALCPPSLSHLTSVWLFLAHCPPSTQASLLLCRLSSSLLFGGFCTGSSFHLECSAGPPLPKIESWVPRLFLRGFPWLLFSFCNPMDYSTPSFSAFTVSWGLLKFMSMESVMLSNHIILCCLFAFSFCLQSFPASGSWISNEWALHIRWPMYWSFSFSVNPSDEYSRLISFRIDLLAVQEAFLIPLQMTLHPSPCLLYSQHSASSALVLLCALICLSFQIIRCICTRNGSVYHISNCLSHAIDAQYTADECSINICWWIWSNCGSEQLSNLHNIIQH